MQRHLSGITLFVVVDRVEIVVLAVTRQFL